MRIEVQNYYCLVDSMIVQAMIQKGSYGFNTFVALRIGEIQDSTKKENWFWLEGSLNIADVLTRGEGLNDEGEKFSFDLVFGDGYFDVKKIN